MYARENLGHDAITSPACFPGGKVRDVFSQPRRPLGDRAVSHVFVAIDPAGGSNVREVR